MHTKGESNGRSVSTDWEWRKVKIRRPPEATGTVSPKARRFRHLPWRDPRQPLTLTIKFRGGPECWYEVHARGSIGRWPGYMAIHDIMSEILGGAEAPRRQ